MAPWFLLAFLVTLNFLQDANNLVFCTGDPTDGFTAVPLTEKNFEIQRPYNLPIDARYSYIDGVRRLWVYSTDKSHFPGGTTKPRTEMHITGHTYSSGVWQFEGNAYVPQGTTGVSIMQIFGANGGATTLMLWVEDGALRYYERQLIEDNIYNRWFRVNVVHNVDTRKVMVFIDGVLKLTVSDHGGKNHFFKFGVYEQKDSSNYMESRWKGVKLFKKSH